MTKPTQRSWIERIASDSAAVTERLVHLQNSHRLALHMVEHGGHLFRTDTTTLNQLNAVPASGIAESMQQNKASYFSMSLLPSHLSGMSLRPYKIGNGQMSNYGYLFNMSQAAPHAARVIRAHETTLNSGETGNGKLLKLNLLPSKIPGLKALYHRFYDEEKDAWENNVIRAAAGEHGSRFTEQQLDLLGHAYEQSKQLFPPPADNVAEENNEPNVVNYNEILVAAHTQHIEAIVIPKRNFCLSQSEPHPVAPDMHMAWLRLQAAVVGLDHWHRGMHLPAVIYNISPPDQGSTTMVGATHEEFVTAALESLRFLGTTKSKPNFIHLLPELYPEVCDTVKRETKLNISGEVTGAKGWLKNVEKKLSQLTQPAPAPSPQSDRTSPASGGRC